VTKYVSEVIGHDYGFSAVKLLKTKSKKEEDDPNQINPERTFFCSELIAKLFKIIGILQNDQTACS